jgi:hypothetical protein
MLLHHVVQELRGDLAHLVRSRFARFERLVSDVSACLALDYRRLATHHDTDLVVRAELYFFRAEACQAGRRSVPIAHGFATNLGEFSEIK